MCLIGVNVKVPTSSYFVFIGCNIKVQSNRETFKLLRCTVENRLIRDEKNVVNCSSVHVVYIFIKSNNNVVNMGFTISASLHDCDLLGGMNLVKK